MQECQINQHGLMNILTANEFLDYIEFTKSNQIYGFRIKFIHIWSHTWFALPYTGKKKQNKNKNKQSNNIQKPNQKQRTQKTKNSSMHC